MHRAFLVFCEEFFEFFICLFWCASFHNSHAIHHTMDVSIDTDKGHIVEMREDDFSCLYSDSRQSDYGLQGFRDFGMEFFFDFFCCHEEMFRLHAIIVHTSEHDFDFLGLEPQEIGRSFYQLEEPLCRFIHSFIRHLSGEHDGGEELKWAREIQLNSLGWVELENFIQDYFSFCFCPEFHKNSLYKMQKKHGFITYF